MTDLFDSGAPCRASLFSDLSLYGSWVSEVHVSSTFGGIACRECYSFFSDGMAVWEYVEENAPGQSESYTYRVSGDLLEMSVTGRSVVVRARFRVFSSDCQSVLALDFEDESDIVLLKRELNNEKSRDVLCHHNCSY